MSPPVCEFFKGLCRISVLIAILKAWSSWQRTLLVSGRMRSTRSGLCRCSHSTSPVSPDSLSTAHTPLCSAANGNALSAVLSFSTAQGCDPGGASLQDTEKPTSACFLFHSQCLAHRCLINAGRRPRVYLSLLLDFMVAQKSKPSATSLSCFLKTSCVWCEAAWCLPL